MIRTVIDTNVFVSGLISSPGAAHKIIRAWEERKLTVLVNSSILDEIHEVLLRPSVQKYHRRTHKQIQEYCEQIERFSVFVKSSPKLPSVPIDPDDLKFFDCAIVGNAEFLVTGDKQLLNFKAYRDFSIVSPALFAQIIE